MILTAMILTTSLALSKPCDLSKYADQLEGWSRGYRSITTSSETHRYHAVTKTGQTVKLAFTARTLPIVERFAGERLEDCLYDGQEGGVYLEKSITP